MIPDHLPDSKCLNLMSHAAWIFDLEKMIDNAGIGKEVILLKQPVRFLMLDYFQLSSYQLQACALLSGPNHLACCVVVDAKTRGPKSAENRSPSQPAGPRAAPHSQLKARATLNPLILQKAARKPRLLGAM